MIMNREHGIFNDILTSLYVNSINRMILIKRIDYNRNVSVYKTKKRKQNYIYGVSVGSVGSEYKGTTSSIHFNRC